MGYFCSDNLGVGEVALALVTVQHLEGEVDMETLLTQRLDDGLGWGEIWQALGLIGKDADHEFKQSVERNKHQDQIENEGEDDQILNQSEYSEQKGTPPGQAKKDPE